MPNSACDTRIISRAWRIIINKRTLSKFVLTPRVNVIKHNNTTLTLLVTTTTIVVQ